MCGMLGEEFAVAAAPITLCDDELFDTELAYLARARNKRRSEFGTARCCARSALRCLGLPAMPLVPNLDRSPWWPTGVIGSISHCDQWAIAACSVNSRFSAIGVDIEENKPLAPELIDLICAENEVVNLSNALHIETLKIGKIIFSLKEAIYKCQYTLTKSLFGFHDIEIFFDKKSNSFRVTNKNLDGSIYDSISKMCLDMKISEGFILSSAKI